MVPRSLGHFPSLQVQGIQGTFVPMVISLCVFDRLSMCLCASLFGLALVLAGEWLPADPGRLPHGIDHHKALAIPDGRRTHAVVAIRECGHSLLLQPVCPLRPSPAQELLPAPLPPKPHSISQST